MGNYEYRFRVINRVLEREEGTAPTTAQEHNNYWVWEEKRKKMVWFRISMQNLGLDVSSSLSCCLLHKGRVINLTCQFMLGYFNSMSFFSFHFSPIEKSNQLNTHIPLLPSSSSSHPSISS